MSSELYFYHKKKVNGRPQLIKQASLVVNCVLVPCFLSFDFIHRPARNFFVVYFPLSDTRSIIQQKS